MVILRRGPGALSWLVFAWLLPSLVFAGVVNRTIDDSFGDSQTGLQVTYQPGGGCCAIKPDVAQAFKGTYNAATYNPGLGSVNITMQFNGTAIYVFFILANNQGDGITTLTAANFTLDGNAPQLFQHAPDLTTTAFQYNQLVYSQTNLINAQHTLVVSTSGVNANVYVNFDYVIYTHDDTDPLLPLSGSTGTSTATSTTPTTATTTAASRGTTTAASGGTKTTATSPTSANDSNNTSKASNVGPIAGGIVAAVVAVALILFLIFFCRRRRRTKLSNTREGEGYAPPPMLDLNAERARPSTSTVVSPFVLPVASSTAQSSGTLQKYAYKSVDSMARPSMASPPNTESPITQSELDSAYGGYITPGTSSHQISYLSNSAPSEYSDSTNFRGGQNRGPLRTVTSGDHLSPGEDLISATSPHTPHSIEAIRLARQRELDERLRTVQQEMGYLTSDMSHGEKSGRARSVRRRTANRNQPGEGGEVVEEEMSMSDMREQLLSMREQIAFLQDQQRSAWAQGLSDDPPPGYTPPARTSARYAVPPAMAGVSGS
ncbi:hypothetical protein BJ912DRAFT_953983 [Pholiota molesta]|nr:hypothetical protein BJ912DRAFT_953983 [Pholiota molesta]